MLQFTNKIPDNAIQDIYDCEMISINPICNKIHENNERLKERKNVMSKLSSLYSNDTDVQKTIQECEFEFMNKILDRNMSIFMTNYLFGDSIKKVAMKEVEIAEKSLSKCIKEAKTETENDNKSNPSTPGHRRSSRKTKSSK